MASVEKYYIVRHNGKRYCICSTKEQAENVKKCLIEKINSYQNKRNCFTNISVSITETEYPTII